MKETNNQFMESLNSYNDMFEKMINIDPTDDPKRIKASLDKHLNAVIDTTTSTIEKSAETLNKQMRQAEEELLDTSLLETLQQEEMKSLKSYGRNIKEHFKGNTDDYLEPLKGFTQKIADMTLKMPDHAKDLRDRVKAYEDQLNEDPQIKNMNEQFKELDAEMKKLNTYVEKEQKNLNDLGIQLDGTVEKVEEKYKAAIDSEGQKFKEQLEREYEKIRERMEEEMKAEIDKATKMQEGNVPALSQLYEEKVDKMEKTIVKLKAECNFLRTRVEELERRGGGNSTDDSFSISGGYDKLLNRLKILEEENEARKEKELRSRDHELEEIDISARVPDKQQTHLKVITPYGKGVLLRRRLTDGFHEVELNNWKGILYIKTLSIDLP